MRVRLALSFSLLLWSIAIHAQILGVIGSSTAAGYGASAPDSAWVHRTAKYYMNLGQLSAYIDLAVSGYTTFKGMPDSYALQHPPQTPDSSANVSQILRLGSDVVVIAFPSNDISAGFTLTQFLSNLRTMYDSVTTLGKRCYVTTTQPREDLSPTDRQTLKQGRDSILAEFGTQALNFWDSVTDPVSLGILPQYSAGDGIHFNDAGHAVLARIANAAGIMTGTPLPLVFTGFTAQWQQENVLLQWTLALIGSDPNSALLEIQRSGDGRSFGTIYQDNISAHSPLLSSWTDDHCLPGRNYYRLRLTQEGKESFSTIVTLNPPVTKMSINKVYLSADNTVLTAELILPSQSKVSASIMNMSGQSLYRESYNASAGTATIRIPLLNFVKGEYILWIRTDQGDKAVKAFVRL